MKISTKISFGFILIIFFAIIGFFANFQLSREVNINMSFLSNSELIIRNSGRLHKTIIDMQSGFRGFLLTGNYNFLDPYYTAIKDMPTLYEEQRNLLLDSPFQLQRLDSIMTLHGTWVEYSNSLINAKKDELDPNIISDEYKYLFTNKLNQQVGKKINDEISERFKKFDRYEYMVREKKRTALNESIETTRKVSIVLASIIIATGLVTAIYIIRIISKRIMSMVHLADEISQGKFEEIEDTQNDELTALSSSLNIMSHRLDKSFSELERKNKELDQFAYVVSHDLKAPLRGMYNVFHWIEEDLSNELSDQMKKYLNMMGGRTRRLESLITGLLEYARIGRINNLPLEETNVKDLLNEISEMIVPEEFTIEVGENMPVFHTQKIRLQQVFTNLVSNAVKYHGGNNGHISISCMDENEQYYKFAVFDNGIGIAPEYHEKIFVIFQTLREKNEQESTGVGLAIVKKIIEDQKGTIEVISDVGKGTSFVFTWPKESVKEIV